jgi:hypothetical protein
MSFSTLSFSGRSALVPPAKRTPLGPVADHRARLPPAVKSVGKKSAKKKTAAAPPAVAEQIVGDYPPVVSARLVRRKPWPVAEGRERVNVCSSAPGYWKQLSPFKLGTVKQDVTLPDGDHVSLTFQCLENWWQAHKARAAVSLTVTCNRRNCVTCNRHNCVKCNRHNRVTCNRRNCVKCNRHNRVTCN